MLNQVAEGILVHESATIQSNAVVVQGQAGVSCTSVRTVAASRSRFVSRLPVCG